MKRKIIDIILLIVALTILIIGTYLCYTKYFKEETPKPFQEKPSITQADEFNSKIIKEVNKENQNYLISPYSIEIALSMLRDGSNNNTKTQIDNIIGNRNINNVTVKNKINVANAAFIKNKYKNNVVDTYYQKLKSNYNTEILYDEFKTPKVLNDWTNKQTKGMIPKLVDDISENFVLGIANAIAIDVEWQIPFKCESTRSEEFTKLDNKKYNVSMMHNSYKGNAKYFITNDIKGVVLPYEKYNKKGEIDYTNGNNLEFVGILPNNNIKDYINNLTNKSLKDIDNNLKETSNEVELKLSLPMFKYNYNYSNFQTDLEDLGIIDVFDANKADLSNMIVSKTEKFYVSQAIHKTHIDLNEKGTKAAAVTAFMIEKSSIAIEDEHKIIEIKFNKPFAYFIRDSKTKEILFFGVVYEPTKWQGSTCSNN